MSRLKSKLERRRQQREASDSPDRSPTSDPPSSGPSPQLLAQLKRRMAKALSTDQPTSVDERHTDESDGTTRTFPLGETVETAEGPVLVNRKSYPPSYRFGQASVAGFLSCGPGLVALSGDPKLTAFAPVGALFLDTETTGLAGGTGTLPFLIGVGWLSTDGRFEVEQLFCRDPSEERAQLELLTRRLGEASSLVTFNGRAFDIPLINTRFVLNRMRNPGYNLPHLDLLAIARRVFRRRLKNCRLGHLESAILGYQRLGDIPGSAIPAAYASFLRGGPVAPIEAVLDHNALDLVSLAALGSVLEQMYQNPQAVEHAADQLGLARAAAAAGEHDKATSHLTRASTSLEAEHSAAALLILAKNAQREKNFEQAKSLLCQALDHCPDDPQIHLRLAIHLEHREKDYAAALIHAARTAPIEGAGGQQKRIDRLNRRLNNAIESR